MIRTTCRYDKAGRECTRCGYYKPWSKFYRRTDGVGLRKHASMCGTCVNDRRKERLAEVADDTLARRADTPTIEPPPLHICPYAFYTALGDAKALLTARALPDIPDANHRGCEPSIRGDNNGGQKRYKFTTGEFA